MSALKNDIRRTVASNAMGYPGTRTARAMASVAATLELVTHQFMIRPNTGIVFLSRRFAVSFQHVLLERNVH
ncbi:hypothetical protein DPMN_084879 [Dreissena polymorpha]|uniref:Uncharacterized protein n=1 Tax=Dreissena polymorpha TaxID=45954 RepID=A0A9D3YF57_DREPO|nr:hypothetical protein DPMN_084879 [Dreissena polymorpha]